MDGQVAGKPDWGCWRMEFNEEARGQRHPGWDGRATPPSNVTHGQACLVESATALTDSNSGPSELVPEAPYGHLLSRPVREIVSDSAAAPRRRTSFVLAPPSPKPLG